jgi:formate/nitrite transporter FocA (FNT family)
MQAVEEQRRVSQQLEDLRMQQRQRTAQLSAVGLKLMGILWCISGALAGGFILLLIMQPELLDQTLNSLDGSIAFVIALATQIEQGLSLIPSSSWLLSAAALAVVLMMGLWIRLMRHPQDV